VGQNLKKCTSNAIIWQNMYVCFVSLPNFKVYILYQNRSYVDPLATALQIISLKTTESST